jgi:hypothetical protein
MGADIQLENAVMGGGFCEIHGPFDPPHRVCPYCQREAEQRRAYGPPPDAPSEAEVTMDQNLEPDDDFVRETIEPDLPADASDVTEIVARPDQPDLGAYEGPPPFCWLVIKEPPAHRGEILNIQPGQVIGREGDVRWPDSRLSRRHAQITFEPLHDPVDADAPPIYAFHLWPFAPTNPVILNGEEVRGATPLSENDELRLGDTLFVIKMLID